MPWAIHFIEMYLYILVIVAPMNEYRTTDAEERKCGYSVCLCDMEMVRCMEYYKNDFNANKITKIGWSTTRCAITGTFFT